MIDDKGRRSRKPALGSGRGARPGGVPSAGDQLTVVENEQRAREVAAYRQEKATEKRTALAPSASTRCSPGCLDDVEFPVVVKADVQGSVEAIVTALHNLSNDEIKVRVLHAGVGAITESDVTLAAAATRRSSASTSAPTPRRASWPSATTSRFRITTSSIT
jgi:translation initiation factor IF-2